MDLWAEAIEHHRAGLLRVVAALFALAGFGDDAPATLPRHIAARLQRVLRPAEAATRRLIVIAAHSLATIHPPFGAYFHGLDPDAARGGLAHAKGGARADGQPRIPAFALVDPVKRRAAEPWKGPPRFLPRICTPGVTEPAQLPPLPAPDDPVAAGAICRRLQALKRALDDIDFQARRLVRWQARRERAFSSPVRLSPLRNGRPPGGRKRHAHEIDAILGDIHSLAIHALAPPNTT